MKHKYKLGALVYYKSMMKNSKWVPAVIIRVDTKSIVPKFYVGKPVSKYAIFEGNNPFANNVMRKWANPDMLKIRNEP